MGACASLLPDRCATFFIREPRDTSFRYSKMDNRRENQQESGGMSTSTNGRESRDAHRDRVLRKLRRIIKDIVATFKAEKQSQARGILSVNEASESSATLHMENVVATVMEEMIKPRQKYGEAQTYHISSWLRKRGKQERQELHELQLAQLKECFELMDTDKGGSIDEDELRECFKLLDINMSKAEAKDMFDEVDGDGSGAIEYDEFVDLMTNVFDSGRGDDKVTGSFESFQLASSSYRRARLLNSMMESDFEETQEMIQKYNDFKENEIRMQKKALQQAADKRTKIAQLSKEKENLEYGEYERRIEAALPKYVRPSPDLDAHRSQLAKAVLPVLIQHGYSGYLPDVTAGSLASFKEMPGHKPASLVLSPRSTPQGTSSFKTPRDSSQPNSPRPSHTVPRRIKMRMQRSGGLNNYESPRTFFYTTLEHGQRRSADSSHESLSREFGARSTPRSINDAESLMRSIGSNSRATAPAAEYRLTEGIPSQRTLDQKRRRSTTRASLPPTPRSSSVVERAAGKQQNTAQKGSFSGYTPRGKFTVCGGGFRHGSITPRQARLTQQTPRNLSQTENECEDRGSQSCGAGHRGKEHSSTSKPQLQQHGGRHAAGQGFRSKNQKHPNTAPSSSTSFPFSNLQLDDIPERSLRRQLPQPMVDRPGYGKNETGCDGSVLPDFKNAASAGLNVQGNNSTEIVSSCNSETLHLGENSQQSPRSIPMFRALPPCDIRTLANGETKMHDSGCRPEFVPRLNLADAGAVVS